MKLRRSRGNLPCAWSTALCALGLVVAQAAPQNPERPAPPLSETERQALRWARELELPHRRAMAFEQLVRLEQDAVGALVPMLGDPRPEVAIRAADVLRFLGHHARAALPALAVQRSHPDPQVAYACRLAHARMSFDGVLMVGYTGRETNIEDADGVVRRSVKVSSAWDAEILPDDHLLTGLYGSGDARELDADGNTVWEYTDPGSVYDCDRAVDGTTWVTCADLGVVRQIDRSGKVIWESATLGRPVDVEALPSGRILVTDYEGRILEIDKEGTVHWELKGVDKPMDADRLPDGSTLVALYGTGEVRVIARNGDILRRLEVTKPQDADLVRGGCIAVAGTEAFYVFDADGKSIWKKAGNYACEITWALDPSSLEAPKAAPDPGASDDKGSGDRRR